MTDQGPRPAARPRRAQGRHPGRPRHRRQGGKTAGRGTKGQGARDTIPMNFEGGQMPLHMRVPKLKGFNNPFRVEYQAVNLDTLEGLTEPRSIPACSTATASPTRAPWSRCSAGASSPGRSTVKAHAVSKAAEQAITAAGGTVEILPLPWGDRRPPAKGNHLTNR